MVAYDRAGPGASDPAPGGDILDRQIADLAAVIAAAAGGQCVLAGHSWGGVLAQLLAFRHPRLVAGLVLVDPAHEDMAGALPRPARWLTRIAGPRVRSVLLRHRMLAPIRHLRAPRTAARVSADPRTRALVAAAYRSVPPRPDELAGLAASHPLIRQLRAAPSPFPDIPVTVLSATRGFPPQLRTHRSALQAGLVAAAPRGRHIAAAGSGHAIHHERPGLVADAIIHVIGETRQARGTERPFLDR